MHVYKTYTNVTIYSQTFFLIGYSFIKVGKSIVFTIWSCGPQRPQTPHYVSVLNNLHLKVLCGTVFIWILCLFALFYLSIGWQNYFAFNFQKMDTMLAYQDF